MFIKHPVRMIFMVCCFTTLQLSAVHSEPKRLWIKQEPLAPQGSDVKPYIKQSPSDPNVDPNQRSYFNRYYTKPGQGRVGRSTIIDRSISSDVKRGVLSARLRRETEIPKSWGFLSDATYHKKLARSEAALQKEFLKRKRLYYKSIELDKEIEELNQIAKEQAAERAQKYKAVNYTKEDELEDRIRAVSMRKPETPIERRALRHVRAQASRFVVGVQGVDVSQNVSGRAYFKAFSQKN